MLKNLSIEDRYLSGDASDEDIIAVFQDSRKNAMKSQGAVYTPGWIVKSMLDMMDLDSVDQRIVEPACGHGSFVLPLIRYARERFSMTWPQTCAWFRAQVSCFDIDPDTTRDLRRIVALLFSRHGVRHPCPEMFDNIATRDGLRIDATGYDIALGNPPYIRTQSLDARYLAWIRGNFEIAARGNIDIYYAFLDKYAGAVETSVFIVPNGCIKAAGARKLRDRVFPRATNIIDFKSRLVFPNARTYTCIIRTKREHDGPCLYRVGADGKDSPVAWSSITGEDIHAAPRIAKSGIATLADSVFRVERGPDDLFYGSHDGKKWPVEAGIVRPLIKATKMGDNDAPGRDLFILFPYETYSGRDVIPESEIKSKFPLAHEYLLTCKQKLLARDRGKNDRYPAWYAYGRSQGLHNLENTRVVFVPSMIGGNSKPREIDTRAMTARHGGPLFVSGYAVTDPACRAALLGAEFRAYVEQNGSPKPGSSELYYAISAKHVNAFLRDRHPDIEDPDPLPGHPAPSTFSSKQSAHT